MWSNQNKTRIASAGGIEAVVKAMQIHEQCAGVQMHGCGALRNLACTPSEIRTRITPVIKPGGQLATLNQLRHKEGRGTASKTRSHPHGTSLLHWKSPTITFAGREILPAEGAEIPPPQAILRA
jgi:hypothetical protein